MFYRKFKFQFKRTNKKDNSYIAIFRHKFGDLYFKYSSPEKFGKVKFFPVQSEDSNFISMLKELDYSELFTLIEKEI